jgi:tripartite-type tricarboxylate transporter receptor subunit TctC
MKVQTTRSLAITGSRIVRNISYWRCWLSGLVTIIFCSFSGLLAGSVLAESDYPSNPIHLIVTQSPGGPSDTLARLVADHLSKILNQSVIVDNRPGAGSIVGTNLVAKSKPDGYTVLLNIAETLGIYETLYKKLPYDLNRELTGVGLIAASSETLIANNALPAKTVKEFIALAKSKSDQLNVGSAGVGSIMHLSVVMLNDAAHINLIHIPYKGAAPAITDVLGGQVQLAFVGTPAAVSLINQHKIIAIATTGGTRDALLPQVPTFSEAGFPDFKVEVTYGFWAPKATPKPIIDKLNEALVKTAQDADFKDRLAKISFETRSSTADQAEAYLQASIKRWRPIVKASGATAN